MRVAMYTLGCKMNQYETQAMEQLLRQRGHEIVPFTQEADAYVVNSCSVTAVSDQKSRQVLHRIRREHPEAVAALCGCYPQTHAEDVRKLDVDLIAGTGSRAEFPQLLEQAVEEKRRMEAIDRAFERRTFEVLPAGGLGQRTRAMLKVEDGCVNFCSYCIIPYARGRVRSLPLEQCAREARTLAEAGYQEIVLTGIEISSWGQELGDGLALIDAVEAICRAVPAHIRVRLGSLEPRTITPEFCRRAAALPNLCPHFHLSMQSGCDSVLARMNRKYDSERYYESVKLLNEAYETPGITTDLIVGFPGETEEEFQQTLAFIRRCAFSAMHIFPYSRRPGTPADGMPGQILNSVKEERAHRAQQAALEMEAAYLDRWVGRTVPVLFEKERDGLWRGHTTRYSEVAAPSGENLHNQLRQVYITGRAGNTLQGELCEGQEK